MAYRETCIMFAERLSTKRSNNEQQKHSHFNSDPVYSLTSDKCFTALYMYVVYSASYTLQCFLNCNI